MLRIGWCILLPCALCVSACSFFRSLPAEAPPSPSGRPPPRALPPHDTREAKLSNGRLTVEVTIPHAPPGPKPAVIAFGGEQQDLLEAGMVVATYRFSWKGAISPKAAVSPPQPQRMYGEWMLASPTREKVGGGFFGLIGGNAGRVPEVVDYLSTLPEVDPERIGITGLSTTGFTALEATAREPRLRVAVVIGACGDYSTFLHLSEFGMKGEPLELDPRYARELESREALRHPEHLTHAALLMVNGTGDRTVPIECARTTAEALRAAYAKAGAPERFRFVAREGAAHSELAGPAREEVLAWLKRWLLPGGGEENR